MENQNKAIPIEIENDYRKTLDIVSSPRNLPLHHPALIKIAESFRAKHLASHKQYCEHRFSDLLHAIYNHQSAKAVRLFSKPMAVAI